jgi:IS4 transposase
LLVLGEGVAAGDAGKAALRRESQLLEGAVARGLVLPARTIADLYRCRWQIELFFKWIKQNLSIKSFFGLSENAVRTQIWIAVSVYVLVAILKKRLKLDASLSPCRRSV